MKPLKTKSVSMYAEMHGVFIHTEEQWLGWIKVSGYV